MYQQYTNLTVTGFEPFYKVKENASEQIIRFLEINGVVDSSIYLSTHVFQVVYENARKRLESVVNETSPDILILIGVSKKARKIRLERIARNLDDSKTPDNQNVVRRNQPILNGVESGEFVSSLPLQEFAEQLNDQGIATEVSDSAGGFICNHFYYFARYIQAMRKSPYTCVLVHVPKLVQRDIHPDEGLRISIETAARGILTLSQLIRQQS